ncbi:hypothetical protein E3N88_35052 [Mikania micrantha]|uniref:Methyltransferase small domain-containing protein n=1 Tax=Mikania micrantha TaxID=192012 RepID=A0A5N6M0A9_9ASTR|nr:hypothetical protein E3N88_35052 [Mikania micrantha]
MASSSTLKNESSSSTEEMNLSTLARATSLSTGLALRTLHRSITCKPISCSSTLYSLTSINPKTPLFLRSPDFTATLSDFQKWQNWAKTLALSVNSSFKDSDNGPDSEILLRELSWLIEDALENPQSLSTGSQVEVLRLRADLGDLYTLWKQRIEIRRPFQYIVGCEHWRDLVLSVEEGVLIPRPETELIIDLVCDVINQNVDLKGGLWVDLGTGSAAIAIGIGRILGDTGRVIATDLSPIAVQVAEFNVKRGVYLGENRRPWAVQLIRAVSGDSVTCEHDAVVEPAKISGEGDNSKDGSKDDELKVSCLYPTFQLKYFDKDKIAVKQGSWFDPLTEFQGQVAGIVSNPPYIPSGHINGLQAEVGRHEPILALDGGENGMSELLHLCNGAAFMLKPGGFFAFETNGEDQCRFLVDHMESVYRNSFYDLRIVPDFAGIRRFVTGNRT